MSASSLRLETFLHWFENGIMALLLVLGVMVTLVFLARFRSLSRSGGDFDLCKKTLLRDMKMATDRSSASPLPDTGTFACRIMAMGHANAGLIPEALEKLFEAQISEEKRRMEQGISFLGTVGANAPFLGLAGTVVGILTAFGKMAEGGGHGNANVLASISNALVATLLGLGVAIPAVVFYNVLKARIKGVLEESRELRSLFLAQGLQSAYSKSES